MKAYPRRNPLLSPNISPDHEGICRPLRVYQSQHSLQLRSAGPSGIGGFGRNFLSTRVLPGPVLALRNLDTDAECHMGPRSARGQGLCRAGSAVGHALSNQHHEWRQREGLPIAAMTPRASGDPREPPFAHL